MICVPARAILSSPRQEIQIFADAFQRVRIIGHDDAK